MCVRKGARTRVWGGPGRYLLDILGHRIPLDPDSETLGTDLVIEGSTP